MTMFLSFKEHLWSFWTSRISETIGYQLGYSQKQYFRMGTVKLFGDMNRNDNRSAGYAQPNFQHLNTSSRPESEEIRNLLEE